MKLRYIASARFAIDIALVTAVAVAIGEVPDRPPTFFEAFVMVMAIWILAGIRDQDYRERLRDAGSAG